MKKQTAIRIQYGICFAAAFVFLLIVAFCTPARSAESYSCDQIRYYVKTYGLIRAIKWARDNGHSWREIADARRCLRRAPIR